MKITLTKIGAWLLFPVMISGCVSNGFQDVRNNVTPRTGFDPDWYQGKPQDSKAVQKIKDLLGRDLTEEGAIQIAVLNNPAMQAKFQELGIARADLIQAGLFKNPNFEGHARVPNDGGSINTEFSINQDFMSIFLSPLRKRTAAAQFEQVTLEVSDAVISLVDEVKTAYYEAQAAEQVKSMRQTVLVAAETAGELAGRQFKAGNVNAIELDLRRADYEQAKINFIESDSEARVAREPLNRLMGLKLEHVSNWRIKRSLQELPEKEPALEDFETFALEERFDYRARRKQIEVFRRQLIATRLGIIEEMEVGFNTEREPGDEGSEQVTGPMWRVTVPVFDQQQAAAGRNKAQMIQAEYQAEAFKNEVVSEVRTAREKMLSYRSQAERYRDSLIPLRKNLIESFQQHYNFMLKGTYELLLAKRDEVEARREYIDTLKHYWVSRSNLVRAMGGKFPEVSFTREEFSPEYSEIKGEQK